MVKRARGCPEARTGCQLRTDVSRREFLSVLCRQVERSGRLKMEVLLVAPQVELPVFVSTD